MATRQTINKPPSVNRTFWEISTFLAIDRHSGVHLELPRGRSMQPGEPDGMNLPSCCFCQKPVLEATGLYEHITDYQLRPEDQALGETKTLGHAHGVCLAQSGDGPFWASTRYQFLASRPGLKTLGPGLGVSGVYNQNLDEYSLYWDDGYSVAFRASALRKGRQSNQGTLLPANMEYNMELIGQDQLLNEMRQALESEGKYALAQFLQHLGIADLVLFPNTLQNSYFAFDQELRELWSGKWVSCRLVYDIFLPESGLTLLSEQGVTVTTP